MTVAPAASASRPTSASRCIRQARSQPGAVPRSGRSGAVVRTRASALLRAAACPVATILPGSAARWPAVTETVRWPSPVTRALRIHGRALRSAASPAATGPAALPASPEIWSGSDVAYIPGPPPPGQAHAATSPRPRARRLRQACHPLLRQLAAGARSRPRCLRGSLHAGRSLQSKALLGAPASSRTTRIISAGSNGLVR